MNRLYRYKGAATYKRTSAMKKSFIPPLIILTATISACGMDFEWFPKVTDTTPPVISISGPVFKNSTGHAPTQTAVSFSADEPATIYYTTNSTAAETAFTPIDFESSPVVGFTINTANTILRFFGIDKSSNNNKSDTKTVTILSP
jgi:Chitobiase/beta-hexosaminidase C-terminal domain